MQCIVGSLYYTQCIPQPSCSAFGVVCRTGAKIMRINRKIRNCGMASPVTLLLYTGKGPIRHKKSFPRFLYQRAHDDAILFHVTRSTRELCAAYASRLVRDWSKNELPVKKTTLLWVRGEGRLEEAAPCRPRRAQKPQAW